MKWGHLPDTRPPFLLLSIHPVVSQVVTLAKSLAGPAARLPLLPGAQSPSPQHTHTHTAGARVLATMSPGLSQQENEGMGEDRVCLNCTQTLLAASHNL